MAKDKVYGVLILVFSLLIVIVYTYWTIWLQLGLPAFLDVVPFVGSIINASNILWALIVPVYLAVVIILLIAAWIGFTMATTPPPAPIEAEEFEDLEEFEAEPETEEEEED